MFRNCIIYKLLEVYKQHLKIITFEKCGNKLHHYLIELNVITTEITSH